MAFAEELAVLLAARYTVIQVVTVEEERLVRTLADIVRARGRPLYVWDPAEGFALVEGERLPPDFGRARDPLSALEVIEAHDGAAVFFLPDLHGFWRDARVVRKLRNVGTRLRSTRKTLVLSQPGGELPPELADVAVQVDLPRPDPDELRGLLAPLWSAPGVAVRLDEDGLSRLVGAARGMTANQAQRAVGRAIVRAGGELTEEAVAEVIREKQAIVRQSGALEFYAEPESLDAVGGLEALKQWIRLRSRAFSDEARAYGLPAPKGVALVGLPGTGKSLVAKTIAGLWQVPLVRLDVGALYGSLVGESEANTRRALALAEAVAPCVLWVDELEKAFATGAGDSGTSRRVLATLETWMQERSAPVFLVATANDIASLPPDLLRRGRFDEVFFLDLPRPAERAAIIRVHLARRGRDPARYEADMERLVAASDRFVGAEIEQSIIDALYAAFNDPAAPRREPTADDIVAAMRQIRPLAASHPEAVEALRRWLAEGRARAASAVGDTVPAARGTAPVLDLPPR